jgi:AraC-like DNA-binding protein
MGTNRPAQTHFSKAVNHCEKIYLSI